MASNTVYGNLDDEFMWRRSDNKERRSFRKPSKGKGLYFQVNQGKDSRPNQFN